jgi:hypothetical protein
MKRCLCGAGWAAVAILAAAACGDSEGGSTTGMTTGGTGGSVGTGGSGGGDSDGGGVEGGTTVVGCTIVLNDDKITYSGTVAPSYTCDDNKSTMHPSGPNSCRNTSDCAIINTGRGRELVRNCGLGCRSYQPPAGTCEQMATCNSNCVKMGTATMIMQPGLSEACGTCYTNVALCSIEFCLTECAGNADAIECVQCQFASGCRVAFERCSGVDRQP